MESAESSDTSRGRVERNLLILHQRNGIRSGGTEKEDLKDKDGSFVG